MGLNVLCLIGDHALTPLTKLGELGTYALESEVLAPALQDLAWK